MNPITRNVNENSTDPCNVEMKCRGMRHMMDCRSFRPELDYPSENQNLTTRRRKSRNERD